MSPMYRRVLPVVVLAVGVAGCDATRAVEAPSGEVSAAVGQRTALRWRVVDLGAPTVQLDAGMSAQGISSVGHVTGQARINTVTHAVSVSPSGRWTVKRPLSGDVGTFPGQINAAGVQVGISVVDRSYSDMEAVIWDREGNPSRIPGLPRSPQEWAGLINDRGYVAGETTKLDPAIARPFVWHPSWAAVRALALPASVGSAATMAMNNRGQIAGYVTDADRPNPSPVIWDVTGARRDLPVLPGSTWAAPSAINDAGVVGGWSFKEDGTVVGWSWTPRRGYVVYPAPMGYTGFQILSIDNEGRLFGAAYTATNASQVYTIVNGKMAPLPMIDGGAGSAIVALSGIMAGRVTVGGVDHTTNWIPKK